MRRTPSSRVRGQVWDDTLLIIFGDNSSLCGAKNDFSKCNGLMLVLYLTLLVLAGVAPEKRVAMRTLDGID